MSNMDLLYKLDEMIEEELRKVVKKGEVAPNEWDNLKKVVCIMKEVKEVERMLNDDRYSNDNYSYRSYNTPFTYRMTYDSDRRMDQNGTMSHMRGRSKTTGRYMSRSDGRSMHSIKDRVVDQIERMYDEATTDHERNVLDEMIRDIEASERY